MGMNTEWNCKDCKWRGFENQLDYEPVEGCVGSDKLEICPKCGSQKVYMF